MKHFFLACEDPLSEIFCKKIMERYFPEFSYNPIIVTGGVSELKKRVDAFINIAKIPEKYSLILTDLDNVISVDNLLNEWQNGRIFPKKFILLVAVKEIESWILADSESFSNWSGIPKSKIPQNPDEQYDIKQILLTLVSRHAFSRLKSDLLPDKGARTSKVGIAYNSRLVEFVDNHWNFDLALANSSSLRHVNTFLIDIRNNT